MNLKYVMLSQIIPAQKQTHKNRIECCLSKVCGWGNGEMLLKEHKVVLRNKE
jgi:hypothetical protein